MVYRVIIAIGKHVVSHKALSRTYISIRVDESAPRGVIVPALKVVEIGFLRLCIAAGANWGEKKLGKTGSKADDF